MITKKHQLGQVSLVYDPAHHTEGLNLPEVFYCRWLTYAVQMIVQYISEITLLCTVNVLFKDIQGHHYDYSIFNLYVIEYIP